MDAAALASPQPMSVKTRTPRVTWPSDEQLRQSFLAQGMSPYQAEEKLKASMEEREKVGHVAREFEANFLAMMLEEMKKTVDKSEYFHGGFGEDVFDSMLSMEQARQISNAGSGLGLAEMVEQSLIAKVVGQQASAAPRDTGGAPRDRFDTSGSNETRPLSAEPGTLDKVRNAVALSEMKRTYR